MIIEKEVLSLGEPGLEIYGSLTERQLRSEEFGGGRMFIAESPKVIRLALERGYRPVSLLCERKHITGDAADIIAALEMRQEKIPVYTGERKLLTQLTGYVLTRGVLCAMERKTLPTLEDVCGGGSLIGVIQSVTDTTNIGSIFRAASALGVDGIVVTPDTCDPLNRRSVRVSMGTVFTVPWTETPDPVNDLRRFGYKTAALALSEESVTLDDPVLRQEPRLAVIFGTEGDGLPRRTIADADYVVKIPMHHGVDSLNVASAAAVTFWELRRTGR